MRTRQTARTTEEIVKGMNTVKAYAREDVGAIHLVPCDFEKVKRKPANFDVTAMPDGKLVTVFRGRLIEVLPSA